MKHLKEILRSSPTSIVLPSVSLKQDFEDDGKGNKLVEYLEKNSKGAIIPLTAQGWLNVSTWFVFNGRHISYLNPHLVRQIQTSRILQCTIVSPIIYLTVRTKNSNSFKNYLHYSTVHAFTGCIHSMLYLTRFVNLFCELTQWQDD